MICMTSLYQELKPKFNYIITQWPLSPGSLTGASAAWLSSPAAFAASRFAWRDRGFVYPEMSTLPIVMYWYAVSDIGRIVRPCLSLGQMILPLASKVQRGYGEGERDLT